MGAAANDDRLDGGVVAGVARPDDLPAGRGGAAALRLVLDALPSGVVVLDGWGRVREANPAARDLLGSGLVGRSWREVVGERFTACPEPGPDACLRDGRRLRVETRSLGVQPGQVVLLTDVSRTRAIERRVGRLRRASELGDLLAALAHQVRTPLAAALLDASALPAAGGIAGRTRRRLLGRLRHLEGLVEGMLGFARHGRLQVERVDLVDLLGGLRDELAAQPWSQPTRVELRCAPGPCPVLASADALRSALFNLAVNARQAAPGALCLEIALGAATPDGEVRIAFSDDGPGIPPELGEGAFEPFVSGRPGGTGLGLAVTRSIVEAHGGRIALGEPPRGGGACFEITLPVAAGARVPGAGE